MLQQYLPFTVLKQQVLVMWVRAVMPVATVLTVYGIETFRCLRTCAKNSRLQQYLPFTVLKQTNKSNGQRIHNLFVATVLTVYGIETASKIAFATNISLLSCNSTYRLRY